MSTELASAQPLESFAIHEIRNERVVLDTDLATLFGVETRALNQAVKRNAKRFPEPWAMQLTNSEVDLLTSQNVISKPEGRGGRRSAPHVFTEHGVVMAASVLRSERADAVMKLVVDTFVQERRRARTDQALVNVGRLAPPASPMADRLQSMMTRLTEAIAGHEGGAAIRTEAQEWLDHAIAALKDKLSRPGLENQKLAAEATALLAEAEANKAISRKTHAEAAESELRTLANRLRLVIEAERSIAAGELDGFLSVLRELGKPG